MTEIYLRKISHRVIDVIEEHSELSLQDLELKDWKELLPLEVYTKLIFQLSNNGMGIGLTLGTALRAS